MKWQYHIIMMSLFVISYGDDIPVPSRIILLGETGQGKSTLIKNVFKVPHVPIGHTKSLSQTSSVDPYYIKDYTIYDTPGFYDVSNNLTNSQILELIETELQELSSKQFTDINGMLLVISTHKMKESFYEHMRGYISLFGQNMLESLIVVINHHEWDPETEATEARGEIRQTLKIIIHHSDQYDSQLKIPIIIMNCLHPKEEQINELHNAINTVNSYKVEYLDEKRKEIEKIYNEMLLNPENKKDQIKIIKKNRTQITEREELKLVPKTESVKKCVPSGFDVNLGPVGASFKSMECDTETQVVTVHEKIKLKEESIVEGYDNKTIQVLKNERHVYWELAKQEYIQQIREKFNRENANSNN